MQNNQTLVDTLAGNVERCKSLFDNERRCFERQMQNSPSFAIANLGRCMMKAELAMRYAYEIYNVVKEGGDTVISIQMWVEYEEGRILRSHCFKQNSTCGIENVKNETEAIVLCEIISYLKGLIGEWVR